MSKEQTFSSSDILLSTTDLNSHIKYANKNFCDIAGYTLDELKDNPHNMVRHPDMPKAAFKDLWSSIQSGNSWMGPVKNLCKNGDYYWVNAFVTPIKNAAGRTFEYQSIRTKLDEQVKVRANNLYKQISSGNTPKLLSFTTDITLWIQIILMMITLLSALALFTSNNNIWLLLPTMLIALTGSVVFSIWRTKYKKVLLSAKKVFDNSLMSYIYTGNNDAIGAIELSLKMREAEIRAVVGRVSDDSNNISNLAQQSSDCGNDVSEILNQQSMETDQVATAVNQMAATVQEIAQIVTKASHSSQQGLNNSNEGQKIVSQTIESIHQLSDQLSHVEKAIASLINGTKSIELVLSEISSIADQTNLLALNAAIEAARAGEQGRGFAVVAEEVRALAMRSQQSTEEISKLLNDLQLESDNATKAMKSGNEFSKNCVNLANETGKSLENITSEVSGIADINVQIATAVEEQTVVSEQISRNIVTISDMSKQSEEQGLEAVSLSQDLLIKLKDQHSLLRQF